MLELDCTTTATRHDFPPPSLPRSSPALSNHHATSPHKPTDANADGYATASSGTSLNNPSFLLLPTPQGQLLPLPRAFHHTRADLTGTPSKVRPPPPSPPPPSAPLPLPLLNPGHVLYSEVSSSAYQITKTLVPPAHVRDRPQTSLYLATPLSPILPPSTSSSSPSAAGGGQRNKGMGGLFAPFLLPSTLQQEQQVVIKVSHETLEGGREGGREGGEGRDI